MKTTINISIFLAMIFIFSNIQSQTINIQDYKNSRKFRDLTKSSKSKEIKLKDAQTYTMDFKLKKGKTYLVQIEGAKSLGNVQYRIKNINDSGLEVILYDNSLDEFNDKIYFISEFTGEVTLEVITQPVTKYTPKLKKDEVDILIAYN